MISSYPTVPTATYTNKIKTLQHVGMDLWFCIEKEELKMVRGLVRTAQAEKSLQHRDFHFYGFEAGRGASATHTLLPHYSKEESSRLTRREKNKEKKKGNYLGPLSPKRQKLIDCEHDRRRSPRTEKRLGGTAASFPRVEESL